MKTAGYIDFNVKTAGYIDFNVKTAGYIDFNVKTAGYIDVNVKTAGYIDFDVEWLLPVDCSWRCNLTITSRLLIDLSISEMTRDGTFCCIVFCGDH